MGSVSEVLEKARAQAVKRAADADAQYRALIRECAGGKVASPDDVLKRLDKLGRDVGEFQADVETYVRRVELRARYDELGPQTARREAADAELGRLADARVAAYRAADEAFERDAGGQRQARADADAKVKAAERAGRELSDTAPADLRARMDAADLAVRAAGRAVTDLTPRSTEAAGRAKLLADAERKLENARHPPHLPANMYDPDAARANNAEALAYAEREYREAADALAGLDAPLAAARARQAAAVAARAALEDEALTP